MIKTVRTEGRNAVARTGKLRAARFSLVVVRELDGLVGFGFVSEVVGDAEERED